MQNNQRQLCTADNDRDLSAIGFKTTAGHYELPRWFETVFRLMIGAVERGALSCALPDGRVFCGIGAAEGPTGHFKVHDARVFGRLVRDGGNIAFGEAYMDGWWDSPNLQALMDVVLANNAVIGQSMPAVGLVRSLQRLHHLVRSNTKAGARRNISRHYDLGNDFYALWLDPSMTYSSALFSDPNDSLERAQANKYRAICDRLALRPGDHVLEIGCGWGGFAEYAIAHRGVHVTGLTLSQEQRDFAQSRLFKAGLSDRADIRLQDYRDERGSYDAVTSIEMFEAVGERYWPTYFKTVHDRLKPGARAALQMITIADDLFDSYRVQQDFVQRHIFPGGMLASRPVALTLAEQAGLEHVGTLAFGLDYSRTLRCWHRMFNDRWDHIAGLGFDTRFKRMWDFYLTCCAACFEAGTTDVVQMEFRRQR